MEADKNPIPKIDLFPRITRVGRALGRLLTPLPTEAPDFMSDHYRGEVPVEYPDQLQLDFEAQSDKGW